MGLRNKDKHKRSKKESPWLDVLAVFPEILILPFRLLFFMIRKVVRIILQ